MRPIYPYYIRFSISFLLLLKIVIIRFTSQSITDTESWIDINILFKVYL
ncbi:MPPV-210 Rep-like protein [Magpiepox virus 2]|nr:MPPV-210 Rep-like protein [Magpiepox virus 2]